MHCLLNIIFINEIGLGSALVLRDSWFCVASFVHNLQAFHQIKLSSVLYCVEYASWLPQTGSSGMISTTQALLSLWTIHPHTPLRICHPSLRTPRCYSGWVICFALSGNLTLVFMTWNPIKFLQANTCQYGQNGDSAEVMARLYKAIKDFESISRSWNEFRGVLKDIHDELNRVANEAVPEGCLRRRYISERKFRNLSRIGESWL